MDDLYRGTPLCRKPPFDQAWKFPNSIVYFKTTSEVATRPVDRQEPTDLMLRTTKNPSLAPPPVMITIL